jgi:hypothetical protein
MEKAEVAGQRLVQDRRAFSKSSDPPAEAFRPRSRRDKHGSENNWRREAVLGDNEVIQYEFI